MALLKSWKAALGIGNYKGKTNGIQAVQSLVRDSAYYSFIAIIFAVMITLLIEPHIPDGVLAYLLYSIALISLVAGFTWFKISRKPYIE